MTTRAEQKEVTRQAIISSALKLSEEKGFDSLSLRGVSKEAGLAPATFYHHFKDMDDLGLALVNEACIVLRKQLRIARHKKQSKNNVVRKSVVTFIKYLNGNPQLFKMLGFARCGGPLVIREVLQKEKQRFVDEAVEDILKNANMLEQNMAHIQEVSDMMVNMLFNSGVDAIGKSKREQERLIEKLVIQFRIISYGSQTIANSEQYLKTSETNF